MPGRIRQSQQFGTDSKVGSFCGFRDYFHVDSGVYYLELHDAAVRREVVALAYRENAGALQRVEKAALPLMFRSREKENLALSRLLRVGNQTN